MSNIDGSGAGGGGGSENRGVENSSPDAVGVSSPNNADAGSGSIPVSPLEHSSESKETGIEEPPIKQPDGETDPTSLQKDENDSRSNSLMGKWEASKTNILRIYGWVKENSLLAVQKLCTLFAFSKDRVRHIVKNRLIYPSRRWWYAMPPRRRFVCGLGVPLLLWSYSIIIRLFYHNIWNSSEFDRLISPYVFSFASYLSNDLRCILWRSGYANERLAQSFCGYAILKTTFLGFLFGMSKFLGFVIHFPRLRSVSVVVQALKAPPPYDSNFVERTHSSTQIYPAISIGKDPEHVSFPAHPAPWRPDPISIVATIILVHFVYVLLALTAQQNPQKWEKIRSRSLNGAQWSPSPPPSPMPLKGFDAGEYWQSPVVEEKLPRVRKSASSKGALNREIKTTRSRSRSRKLG